MSKIELFYYMLWEIIYTVPIWVRYGIELAIILIGIYVLLHIFKRAGGCICFILKIGVRIGIYFIQYILTLRFRHANENKKNRLAGVDEGLNSWGRKLTEKMENAQRWFKEKKIVINKKRLLVVYMVLLIATILPEFRIVQSLNEQYRTFFCMAQNQMEKFQQVLTPRINEYPELFKEEEGTEMASQEMIYLQLNEKGRNGANVRTGPSLDDESILVINSENTILYLGEVEYDGTRYWLKVRIDDNETVGWLCKNLVETSGLE